MDFFAPPMYDVSNIDMWKFKMSAYLKTLWLHVKLVITKKLYVDNDKYLGANAQVIDALKHTLSKEHIFFYFILWFHFCSVEHIDLSQGTTITQFGENLEKMSLTNLASWSKGKTPLW